MIEHQDFNSIIVRTFTEKDLERIVSIYNQHIADGNSNFEIYPYSLDKMKSIVSKFNSRETILVAEKQEKVIGWGIIKRYSDRLGYRVCCETSIYFDFAQIGRGYGKILQQQLLEKVKELNYHHVVAKILACNPRSIQFHQKFGFEIVGTQKEIGFTQGKWQDIVIMQLIFPEIQAFPLPE